MTDREIFEDKLSNLTVDQFFRLITEVPKAYLQKNKLETENAELKGRLAAAVKCINHYAGCWECRVRDEQGCAEAFYIKDCPEWQWRGEPGGGQEG